MRKSNKELAVEMYIAYLQAHTAASVRPESKGVHLPSQDEMVDYVKALAKKLSSIEDNG